MKTFIASLLVLFTLTACTYDVTDRKTVLQMANDTNIEVGDNGGWCSGTVVNKKERLISTAAHCVENLKSVFRFQSWDPVEKKYKWHAITTYRTVELNKKEFDRYGNQTSRARVIGRVVAVGDISSGFDAALIKIESSITLNDEAVLANDPVAYGDYVFNIGNPYLIPDVLATGRVVAPRINIMVASFIPKDAIVTDAAIGPGHSGGATYNAKGEYIGMTNWKPPGSNHTILLPVRYVKKLLKEYYEQEGIVIEKPEGTLWSRLTAYLGS